MQQLAKCVRPGAVLKTILRAEILFGLGFFTGAFFGAFGHGLGWW